MRGEDKQQLDVFSYVSPEQRVPQDHPLRPLRVMTDAALRELQPRFNKVYAKTGRPSIAPEKLLRALLLQLLYTVRSERMLMEQLDYNLLFRWFVGLEHGRPVWDVTVFTKNRERLLEGDIAEAVLPGRVEQARRSWSCCRTSTSRWMARCWKRGRARRVFNVRMARTRAAGRSGQSDGGFPRREAAQRDARIDHGPGCEAGAQGRWQRSEAELLRES